jgi:hypothetical protein
LHITSLLDVRKTKVKSQKWEKLDLKRLAACGTVMIVCGCYHSSDKQKFKLFLTFDRKKKNNYGCIY